jgi:hypothetical protein
VTGAGYNFAEDPGYVPNGPLNSNPTYTYRDNVTKIIGSHNLQFGGYFVAAQKNELPQPSIGTNGLLFFDSSATAVTTGNPFADLLLGQVATFQQEKAATKTYNRYKIFEPYFQDDWHATSRLTLNLGLRVSMFGTYREIQHSAWNFDPRFYVPGASGIDANGNVTGNPFNGWVQCGVAAGVPVGCMKGHLFNPAPRIGFAWDPRGDAKWALRGGYGVFFEHTNQGEANAGTLEQYNPQSQTATVINKSGYNTIVPQSTSSAPLTFISIPNQVIWPYMQQWHLDIERNIAKNTVATVSYVGSKGTHLTRSYELNQVAPVAASQNPYKPGEPIGGGVDSNGNPLHNDCGTTTDSYGVPTDGSTPSGVPIPYATNAQGLPIGPAVNLGIAACGTNPNPFRPYVGIGSITRKDETGSSIYHGLEVAVRHSVGGLQLNFAYTYSHSIDDSSDYNDTGFVNSYNLDAYRASSNFDQRHNLNVGYVYDLPFFKSAGLKNRLLGGWEWSGITLIQSGTPFSVYNGGGIGLIPGDNAGVANGIASGGSYPDLVGNPRAGVQNSSLPFFGPLLYNPAAFAAPTGLTFGTAGRNILNNPWRTNFDMALLKHFLITESRYFEFRAEAFNVFNHTEWAWLGGDGGSAANNAGSGITSANSIACYGVGNNSAGDPSCSGNGLLRPGSAHNARILQLALKFIF